MSEGVHLTLTLPMPVIRFRGLFLQLDSVTPLAADGSSYWTEVWRGRQAGPGVWGAGKRVPGRRQMEGP